jgi:hypothetical protein
MYFVCCLQQQQRRRTNGMVRLCLHRQRNTQCHAFACCFDFLCPFVFTFVLLSTTTTTTTNKWNGTTVFAQTKKQAIAWFCLLFCFLVSFCIYFRVIVNNNNDDDDDEKCVFFGVCNNKNDDYEMEWYDCVCTDKETHNVTLLFAVLFSCVLLYLLSCYCQQQQQQRR